MIVFKAAKKMMKKILLIAMIFLIAGTVIGLNATKHDFQLSQDNVEIDDKQIRVDFSIRSLRLNGLGQSESFTKNFAFEIPIEGYVNCRKTSSQTDCKEATKLYLETKLVETLKQEYREISALEINNYKEELTESDFTMNIEDIEQKEIDER